MKPAENCGSGRCGAVSKICPAEFQNSVLVEIPKKNGKFDGQLRVLIVFSLVLEPAPL
jgi:hypothetical protein